MNSGENAGQRVVFRVLIKLLFLCSFLCFSINIAWDYFSLGNEWKQGDWLINSVNAPVRRSFTGDLFIWVSDQTGLELLLLVCLTQVLLAALLHAFVLKLVINDESGALMLKGTSKNHKKAIVKGFDR